MTARVSIEMDSGPVTAALGRLSREIDDLTPVFAEIGGYLETSVLRRFEREEGPGGEQWLPSARAQARGGMTLTDTGRLRQSITHSAGPDEVTVGTNVMYAAIHQLGGDIEREARRQTLAFDARGRFEARAASRARRGGATRIAIAEIGESTITIPARPFLGIDNADAAAITEIVADHLREAVA